VSVDTKVLILLGAGVSPDRNNIHVTHRSADVIERVAKGFNADQPNVVVGA
jgi:hypothetical protein